MTMSSTKPVFLLDTGPLSVLCGFPIKRIPYIQTILEYADIALPDAVIGETQGAGKIARVVLPLLKSGAISQVATPATPLIVDTAYSRDLGPGERAVIKCGLSAGMQPVIDDQDAFMAACRFKLRPIVFQDFIVSLVRDWGMPTLTGIEMVQTTRVQFPAPYLVHTLDMLS
jgi:hypothetical protein